MALNSGRDTMTEKVEAGIRKTALAEASDFEMVLGRIIDFPLDRLAYVGMDFGVPHRVNHDAARHAVFEITEPGVVFHGARDCAAGNGLANVGISFDVPFLVKRDVSQATGHKFEKQKLVDCYIAGAG
jgi:hypothetical protein